MATLLFFIIILHSSYIAYDTLAIFATISVTSKYALALILGRTILLAVPTPSSCHSFQALCPPTFLPLNPNTQFRRNRRRERGKRNLGLQPVIHLSQSISQTSDRFKHPVCDVCLFERLN
jgi:hypothetical protein